MPDTINLIVFDFDGTLVDSNDIKRQAFYELLPKDTRFASILDKILETNYTATRQEILSLAMELYHSEPNVARAHAQDCIHRYGEITTRMVAKCPQIEGAEDVLEALFQCGYSLALNSGTPKDVLVEIAHIRGWTHWFTHILGAPQSKRENTAFLVERMDIPSSAVVMVGDRETDREGAKEANCHFIGLLRPDSDFKSKPRRSVTSLDMLQNFIELTWGVPVPNRKKQNV